MAEEDAAAAAAPAEAAAAPAAAADLESMSKEELLAALVEEDRKCRSVQEQLKDARHAAVKDRLRQAQKKTFSEKEQQVIRKAFDTFDKDKSGKIDLTELRAVARELSHEMGEDEAAEAMKLLDKNKDGTLDWEEFLSWWGDDSRRGGHKGVKLALIRAKMRADLLREELSAALGDITTRGVQTRPQSLTGGLTVGKVDSSFAPKTKVQVVAIPSNPTEFEEEAVKLLPDDFPFQVPVEDVGTVGVRLIASCEFNMRESATEAELTDVLAAFSPLVAMANESMENDDGRKARIVLRKTSAGGKLGVTALFLMRLQREEHDAVYEAVSKIADPHARDVDTCMPDVFSVASLLVQMGRDVGDAVKLDSEESVVDLLGKLRVTAHTELSGNLVSMLEGFCFRKMMEDCGDFEETRKPVLFDFGARLLDSVEARVSAGNPAEAIDSVAQGLADFPLKFAARAGKLTPEIEEECKKLKAHFKATMGRAFFAGAPISGVLSMLLMKLQGNEQVWALVKEALGVVQGVRQVMVMHPMVSVKATAEGLDVAKHFVKDDDERTEKVEAGVVRISKFMSPEDADATSDGGDAFPHVTELLDGDGDLCSQAICESFQLMD